MEKKRFAIRLRYQLVFLALLALVALGIVLNVNTGSVNIPVVKIFKIIFLRIEEGSVDSKIIWSIRLPRLLTAAVLGGALAVSGFLLQTFFRNPIAGPFVLGISSGAKMCVGFVIIFIIGSYGNIPPYLLVLAAFVGSLIIMGFVLLFSQRAKNMSMLLVIGIMIGYICSAVTDLIITFAEEEEIVNLTFWSMGSFSGKEWGDVAVIAGFVLAAFLGTLLLVKPISAFRLGEGYAQSMGMNVRLFRVLLLLLSSLLSACVVAYAGPVSFVGIAVPHLTKRMFSSSKPSLILPGSFLLGAVFCLVCDLIARTVFAPTELAISTVTAVLGAPVVIAMLLSRRRGGV